MFDSVVIAKYFLFLDKKKKYFYEREENSFAKDEISTTFPSAGNFRLNKLLFIANVLYIAKNDEPFFYNKICAFEYGPVVYKVLKNFRKISEENIKDKKYFDLPKEAKKYIKKIYTIFSKYSDQELLDFVHEDPNWYLAREKWQNATEKQEQEVRSYIILNKENFQFYKDHLSIYVNRFNL